MQPAITLTFATQADLETFIEKNAPRVGFVDIDHLDKFEQRLQRLEIAYAKVVETNVRLAQRMKAIEEDGVQEWDGAEPAKQEAA